MFLIMGKVRKAIVRISMKKGPQASGHGISWGIMVSDGKINEISNLAHVAKTQ
jgi:hypothetical protein